MVYSTTGDYMRTCDDEMTKKLVRNFYDNISMKLKEMKIRWMDLAKIVGIDHRTLSSMKSQNQNPSITVGLKIAAALDCTIEELVKDPTTKNRPDIEDLNWLMHRVLDTNDSRIDQIAKITCTLADKPSDIWNNRKVITREEMKQKVHDIEYPEGEYIPLDYEEGDEGCQGIVIEHDIRDLPKDWK